MDTGEALKHHRLFDLHHEFCCGLPKHSSFLIFFCPFSCPWLAVTFGPALAPCCALLFLFVLANFTLATFMDAGVLPVGQCRHAGQENEYGCECECESLTRCFSSKRGRGQGRRVPRAALQERGREGRPGAHEVVLVVPLLQAAALLPLQRVRSLRGG